MIPVCFPALIFSPIPTPTRFLSMLGLVTAAAAENAVASMLGFNNCSEARAFAFFNRFIPSAENAVNTTLLGFLGGLRDMTILLALVFRIACAERRNDQSTPYATAKFCECLRALVD
jgi:hypothetical protein